MTYMYIICYILYSICYSTYCILYVLCTIMPFIYTQLCYGIEDIWQFSSACSTLQVCFIHDTNPFLEYKLSVHTIEKDTLWLLNHLLEHTHIHTHAHSHRYKVSTDRHHTCDFQTTKCLLDIGSTFEKIYVFETWSSINLACQINQLSCSSCILLSFAFVFHLLFCEHST